MQLNQQQSQQKIQQNQQIENNDADGNNNIQNQQNDRDIVRQNQQQIPNEPENDSQNLQHEVNVKQDELNKKDQQMEIQVNQEVHENEWNENNENKQQQNNNNLRNKCQQKINFVNISNQIEQEQNEQEKQDKQKEAYIEIQIDSKPLHTNCSPPKTSNQDISYMNQLQILLHMTRRQCSTLKSTLSTTQQQLRKTKQSLKKLRFDYLSSKQQISSLSQSKQSIQKQSYSLKEQIKSLKQIIQTYKQAGDINFYKNKIVEMENLIQIQRQQISMKEKMIDEKDEQGKLHELGYSKVNLMEILDKYQRENLDLKELNKIGNKERQNLKEEIEIIKRQNENFQMDIFNLKQNLSSEQTQINSLRQQLKQKQEQFYHKIKQLQQNLQNLNQNSAGNNNYLEQYPKSVYLPAPQIQKSLHQKYGIQMMSPLQQRDLILKQFIELEIKHTSTLNQLKSLKQRHFNSLKEIKNISSTHIQKKEYNELYKKYIKLRKCLENSLKNESNLKKELRDVMKDRGEGNEFNESNYRVMILEEEPKNPIQQVETIIQKSNQSHKQLFTMKQQLEVRQRLFKSQKINKQYQQRINLLQCQLLQSKKFLDIYDKQVVFKNSQIQILRQNNKDQLQKIIQFEKQSISSEEKQKLISEIMNLKVNKQVIEIKNLQILKENNILRSEKNMLNQLYTNLKVMYDEIMNRQPQLQAKENKNQHNMWKLGHNIMDLQGKIVQIHECKKCIQRQQFDKNKVASLVQASTETTMLASIYYKEIKQLLMIFRKFPVKVDDITKMLQGQKLHLNEIKAKYDQIISLYVNKLKSLEEEKKGNDQWRSKQKEEIRQEFQQIRDFILNDRLIHAMRKAKSLIEYLEQQTEQQEGDQNAEGEKEIHEEGEIKQGNQKIQEQEKSIEQEKQ